MKPLDMADKYEPLSYQDEYADPDSEPTVKVHMPNFLPKVIVEDGVDFDDDPTLPSAPSPVLLAQSKHQEEKTYPGVGLLLCLVTGGLFWGTVLYFIFR